MANWLQLTLCYMALPCSAPSEQVWRARLLQNMFSTFPSTVLFVHTSNADGQVWCHILLYNNYTARPSATGSKRSFPIASTEQAAIKICPGFYVVKDSNWEIDCGFMHRLVPGVSIFMVYSPTGLLLYYYYLLCRPL